MSHPHPAPIVSVAIVSDREIVRAGIMSVLARHPRRINAHIDHDDAHADVLVVDAPSWPEAPSDVVARAADRAGAPRSIVIVVDRDDDVELLAQRWPGARIARLDTTGADLVESVADAARDTRAGAAGAPRWLGAELGLSRRESDALALLAEGRTNAEIADAMCINIETVKSHLKRVYHCLGARNRTQAAAWAVAARHRTAAKNDDRPGTTDRGDR